jgi:bifunctional enzyme Fae/Hps
MIKRNSILSRKRRYLQVAFNSTMEDAQAIIASLPLSDRIILEAGTPLIKRYGTDAIRQIRTAWEIRMLGVQAKDAATRLFTRPSTPTPEHAPIAPYIVADMKTIDRGETEVAMAAQAGANAVVAMGSAPIETLTAFIKACEVNGVDAMIDMMNVPYPLAVLTELRTKPTVVILHRGVDEERDNRSKSLPLFDIRRIKGAGEYMIAIAGGDAPREVQSAIFNDADIVVIWKSVYSAGNDAITLVNDFLKEIK